ncbi:MAG: hypothetical protein IPM46_03535 [Flavobacteriales bacterium]|nr:hypothetical protein [Flavobacteriales bacterium]
MSRTPTHLVRVREGNQGLLPLVCVHGDDANRLLPKYLDPQRPFYAFIHQGKDGEQVELTTLDAIASRFLGELNQAGIHPPYALCGYSFGGLVAYEMAQQLTQSIDGSVPLLVLIDTYAPELHAQAMRRDHKLHVRIRDKVYQSVLATYLANGAQIPRKLHHFHIIHTYDMAVRAYQPKPYPGRMIVIKAADSWGPEDLGWHGLAPEGMEVRLSSGNHFNIIKEPHLKHLAGFIEEGLRGIELSVTHQR